MTCLIFSQLRPILNTSLEAFSHNSADPALSKIRANPNGWPQTKVEDERMGLMYQKNVLRWAETTWGWWWRKDEEGHSSLCLGNLDLKNGTVEQSWNKTLIRCQRADDVISIASTNLVLHIIIIFLHVPCRPFSFNTPTPVSWPTCDTCKPM